MIRLALLKRPMLKHSLLRWFNFSTGVIGQCLRQREWAGRMQYDCWSGNARSWETRLEFLDDLLLRACNYNFIDLKIVHGEKTSRFTMMYLMCPGWNSKSWKIQAANIFIEGNLGCRPKIIPYFPPGLQIVEDSTRSQSACLGSRCDSSMTMD
jgi:hypothetical protein